MKLLVILFSCAFSFFAWAQNEKAEIKISNSKTNIVIKLTPPPGTEFNYEGPWTLEFSKYEKTLKFQKNILQLSDFDRKKDQFTIPFRVTTKFDKSNIDIKLVYFLCSKDHTWCRREEFKNSYLLSN